jgi:hypothetical protein
MGFAALPNNNRLPIILKSHKAHSDYFILSISLVDRILGGTGKRVLADKETRCCSSDPGKRSTTLTTAG